MGGRGHTRGRARLAVLAAVVVLLLAACEGVTVLRVNEQRAGTDLPALVQSAALRDAARARAAQMCALGAATESDDLPGNYLVEPATALAELVGSAPLDPTIAAPGQRNGHAGNQLWDQWRDDPRLVDPRWESIGVGEHECEADATLYSAMVLRDDPPDLGEPADTSQIVAAETTTADGYTWQRYRNLAYPCAIGGYHSFVVGAPTGSSPTSTRPLWVRLRGGGVGYFNEQGQPQPGAGVKSEESLATQMTYNDGGLWRRAQQSGAGFRMVIVSMCSHDIYAGNDNFDPYNPNLTPDGATRSVSGLTATKAAVQYTRDLLPTDDTVLHGTSAGGYGVYTVGWALQRQGIPATALVSDSGVLNHYWQQYVAETGIPGSTGCTQNTEERTLALLDRLDRELIDPSNQPHLLVADGRLEVPVMHVWNQGDVALCGNAPMPCLLPDGTVVTLWAADCQHAPMRATIDALGPGSPSTYLRLCVAGAGAWPCDRHVPTRGNHTNTDPGAPADYNGAILAWVLDRLADA